MYKWEPEKIRFMREASEYSDYYELILDCIKECIDPNDHICDVGCGLGYLSMELAKVANKVTAIDIHNDALQVLRENVEKRNIKNINVVHDSIYDFAIKEKFNKMVFCFFGDVEEVLQLGNRFCEGEIIIVARNYRYHRFSKSARKIDDNRVSYSEICRILENKGIVFRKEEIELEFGQPFKYLSDVPKFFELYSKGSDVAGFTKDELEGMIFKTGREDFPFYLPQKREIGIIRLLNKEMEKKNETIFKHTIGNGNSYN